MEGTLGSLHQQGGPPPWILEHDRNMHDGQHGSKDREEFQEDTNEDEGGGGLLSQGATFLPWSTNATGGRTKPKRSTGE